MNLHINKTADMLACVPYMLEFKPVESLVVMIDREGRLASSVCYQLPEGMEDAGVFLREVFKEIVELPRDDIALSFIVYTDRESQCGHHPPFLHEVSVLQSLMRAYRLPFPVRASVLQTSTYYQSYGDEEQHPLTDLKDSPLALEFVLQGKTYAEGGMPSAQFPDPVAATPEIEKAVNDFTESIYNVGSMLGAEDYMLQARRLFNSLMNQGHGATEQEAIQMISYIQISRFLERMTADINTGVSSPDTAEAIKAGIECELHSEERIDSAKRLLLNLCQYASEKHRPNVYWMLAWTSWASGQPTVAEEYLAAAEKISGDPFLPLALRAIMREVRTPNKLEG